MLETTPLISLFRQRKTNVALALSEPLSMVVLVSRGRGDVLSSTVAFVNTDASSGSVKVVLFVERPSREEMILWLDNAMLLYSLKATLRR